MRLDGRRPGTPRAASRASSSRSPAAGAKSSADRRRRSDRAPRLARRAALAVSGRARAGVTRRGRGDRDLPAGRALLPGGPGARDVRRAWHAGAPPIVTMRKEDAAALPGRWGGAYASCSVDAAHAPGARAANVVGPAGPPRGGRFSWAATTTRGSPASFDDASGVAATLVLARAFIEAGVRPRHPIGFISHTAEEYGSRSRPTTGARRLASDHASRTGMGCARAVLPEHRGLGCPTPRDRRPARARRVDAPRLPAGRRDGLLPHGFRLGAPNT